MTEDNEFEDWSHPTRSLSLPPRRRQIRWQPMRIGLLLLAAAVSCGLFAGFWEAGHLIAQTWRTLNSR